MSKHNLHMSGRIQETKSEACRRLYWLRGRVAALVILHNLMGQGVKAICWLLPFAHAHNTYSEKQPAGECHGKCPKAGNIKPMCQCWFGQWLKEEMEQRQGTNQQSDSHKECRRPSCSKQEGKAHSCCSRGNVIDASAQWLHAQQKLFALH